MSNDLAPIGALDWALNSRGDDGTSPGVATGRQVPDAHEILQALHELAAAMRDLRHQQTRGAGDLNDWLVRLELEGKAQKTLYAYHREIARLLRAYPDHEIGDFTAAEIETVLAMVGPRSRHITRSIYNKFFEWGTMDDRVDRTPMGKVAKIKHPPHRQRDIFTLGEVALLEGLPAPHGQLFAILFGSGLRRMEARKLRRRHIDLPRRRLTVVEGKGGKDGVVALLPSALQAVDDLDLLEGLQPDDCIWGSRPGGGQFVSRYQPIGNTTFERWYRNCIAEAEVRYLSPHTTRHTFHELLRRAGLTLDERQLLMRHASVRTTVDQYGHLDFDEVADKLAGFRLEDV
jgi:integrase